ncbi:MAG: hypothetical protein QOE76_2425 [Frankiales bacterium]|nr:hypothetical protein [Frankiales bacterium]
MSSNERRKAWFGFDEAVRAHASKVFSDVSTARRNAYSG